MRRRAAVRRRGIEGRTGLPYRRNGHFGDLALCRASRHWIRADCRNITAISVSKWQNMRGWGSPSDLCSGSLKTKRNRFLPLLSITRFLLCGSSLALVSCASRSVDVVGHGSEPVPDLFQTKVKPLFEQRCVWCHSGELAHGGLNLQDRAGSLDPARRFIIPGKSAESSIYRALTLEAAHPKVMPGDGWGITRRQSTAVRDWIEHGAPWPEDSTGKITRKPLRIDRDDFL